MAMESLVVGVLTQIDGDGVGYAVEEPPPHAQHISTEVKSSSTDVPHKLGYDVQVSLFMSRAPLFVSMHVVGDAVGNGGMM